MAIKPSELIRLQIENPIINELESRIDKYIMEKFDARLPAVSVPNEFFQGINYTTRCELFKRYASDWEIEILHEVDGTCTAYSFSPKNKNY
jgi:hypothetical protein